MYKNARNSSLVLALALLSLPVAVAHAQTPASPGTVSAFLAAVRQATAPYTNINVAAQAGWFGRDPFCVSGPDHGAMGVHVVNPALIGGNQPQLDKPQILIYEPQADGSMVLVGVEYVVIAAPWNAQHPDGSTPKVAGQLMNLVPSPNRYGLPALYELHAWAWRNNTQSNFADWNQNVTCQKQPLPAFS
ncbi:MAG TPA: hypothetical protein VFJ87_05535 [Rhodanobacteraceae bacterium]|jgi:hypothetical protein|nr:hypothetical protein [Rhodanobacteraceae bacterium]